jgi:anti-anti-sigma factor
MRQDQLTIEVVPDSASVTLRLVGEIDMCSAESIRDAAFAAIHQHHTDVHVDMSSVTFMDSTGLQVLLAARRRAELAGGRLNLLNPTRAVLRVLEVTGVDHLFEIERAAIPAAGPAPATL